MKIKVLLSSLVLALFIACSTNTSDNNLAQASFDVGGMTCQMGCANSIQEKLVSLSGVEFAEVDFSEGQATVRYSIEIVSKGDIISEVESMGGGDKYVVSNYNELKAQETSNDGVSIGSESSEDESTDIQIPTRISFPNIFLLLSR